MAEAPVCCICDDVTADGNSSDIRYTHCCTDPVCLACQADLQTLQTPLQCLQCGSAILYRTLITSQSKPQWFSPDTTETMAKLKDRIRIYHKTITKLTQQLQDHTTNLDQLALTVKDLDVQQVRSGEYYRVVKPLQTTIQDNLAVLQHLEHLKTTLMALTAQQRQETSDQTRLIHLEGQIRTNLARKLWSPLTMVLKPLWYCRHPLGKVLAGTDLASDFVTEQRFDFTSLVDQLNNFYLSFSGYDSGFMANYLRLGSVDYNYLRYCEIAPGQFVLLVSIQAGLFFVCTPICSNNNSSQNSSTTKLRRLKQSCHTGGWRILLYLADAVLPGTVQINASYVVYQKTTGIVITRCDLIKLLACHSTNPVSLTKVNGLNCQVTRLGFIPDASLTDNNPVKLITLQNHTLWCQQGPELRCYDLTSLDQPVKGCSQPSYQAYPLPDGNVDVISYHQGIYVTKAGNGYHIRSLNYPQRLIQSFFMPKVYCDGSVIYYLADDRGLVCNREDLSHGQTFKELNYRSLLFKTEINSAGQLFNWITTYSGELIIRTQA